MGEGIKRLLIVGGVAGGASCAARARRLCEPCESIMFDRGPFVSFATCGLPYFVRRCHRCRRYTPHGHAAAFHDRFHITVRTEMEVIRIDRVRQEIDVHDRKRDQIIREPYDALVLATGARAIRPPLPGSDLPAAIPGAR